MFFLRIISLFFRAYRKMSRVTNLYIAKSNGLTIGQSTILVGDQYFGTEPYLINIGDKCLITDGVRFITHDGSIQVPIIMRGEKIENVYSKKSIFNKIEIGNNVFIGNNAIILPGSVVGDNSIIGAGSVIKGVFSAGAVICGSPGRQVSSIDKFFDKHSSEILEFDPNIPRRRQIADFMKIN